jgi:phage tail-like protein
MLTACNRPKTDTAVPDAVASAGQDAVDPLCPSESPAPVETAVDVPVRYTLTITGTDFSASVSSAFAFGLEHQEGDNFAPLTLSVAESESLAALADASKKVQGVIGNCTDAGTDCNAAWEDQRAALTWTAVLVMATDSGPLATWTLDDVFPLELATAEQTTRDAIVSLTLSAHVKEFAVSFGNAASGGFAGRWKAPELNSNSDTHRGYLGLQELHRTLESQSKTGLHFMDDYAADPFRLEVDGAIIGAFKEAHGIASDLVEVRYTPAGQTAQHRRPGKAKYKNIVLRRGAVSEPYITWHQANAGETAQRKSGSIVYLDREGDGVRRYNLYQAEPNKLKTGDRPIRHVSGDPHVDRNDDRATTHVHGDPHVDQKDGTRWDYIAPELELAAEKVDQAR